jgi:ABC-type branched-subunit amino acid transport system permease subunit
MTAMTTSELALSDAPQASPWYRGLAGIAVAVLLLALVPSVASFTGNPFLIKIATRVVVCSMAAVSLNLILGYGGLVNLAAMPACSASAAMSSASPRSMSTKALFSASYPAPASSPSCCRWRCS